MRLLRRRDDHDVGSLSEERKKDLPHLKGNLCRCTGYHSIEDAIRGIGSVEEDKAGQACGASLANPFSEPIVTGNAHYTMDVEMEGMLHLKVLRSPHAHARIAASARDGRSPCRGSTRFFTWEDVPRRPSRLPARRLPVDPDDTYMLDNVVRFVGQRVAAVVAETEAAAERAAGCSKWTTRCCPPCSIRKRPCCRTRQCCTTRGLARGGNVFPKSKARSVMSPRLRRGGRRL